MPESNGVGDMLRRAREARRLSLADAERLTKIRGAHLAALEEERYEQLPPRPYLKGFVRTYARLLGLDAGELIAEIESRLPPETIPGLSRAVEIPLEPAEPRSRWRRLLTYALWVVLVAALWAGYVGYTQLREFARSGRESPPAASPGPFAEVTPGPAPSAVTPGISEFPTPEPTPPPAVGPEVAATPGITAQLTTTGTSWIRVTSDGRRVFQGILVAGEGRRWSADRALIIRVGNAVAVDLIVNGRPLGPLGGPGQVVELRFPESREEP